MLLSFKTHSKKFQANNFKVTFPAREVQGRQHSSSSAHPPAQGHSQKTPLPWLQEFCRNGRHSSKYIPTEENFQGTTSQSYANLNNLSLPSLFTTLQKRRMRDCLSSAATKYQTTASGRRLEAREFQSFLLETSQMKKTPWGEAGH